MIDRASKAALVTCILADMFRSALVHLFLNSDPKWFVDHNNPQQ
jgi:hypothetical protein